MRFRGNRVLVDDDDSLIDFFNRAVRQYLLGGTLLDDRAGVEQHDPVAIFARQVQIVKHDRDGKIIVAIKLLK